jgi:hypothetical protein
MKSILSAIAVLTVMAMGNVVACGVFLVLADVLKDVSALRDNYFAWVGAGIMAAASALAFLAGALPACFRLLQRF